jgi:hypothetical protein
MKKQMIVKFLYGKAYANHHSGRRWNYYWKFEKIKIYKSLGIDKIEHLNKEELP